MGTLTRFVFTDSHIRSDGTVKWQAFMPKDQRTSVFRTDGLMGSDPIWAIGNNVAQESGRRLKGRADFYEEGVINLQLHVQDSVPPPRHANIIGWADKPENMIKALELERISTGHKI